MRTRLKLSVLLSLGLVLFLAGTALAAVNYPLSISAGGDRIVDASGRKVFFQGDAPWHMMIRLTREEVIQYFDDRQAKGFNALLFSIVVGDGYYGSSVNRYGEQPFLASGDFTQPNEAYFEHADWVLEQANLRGITAFLTPTYIGYDCNAEGWCNDMKAAGVTVMRDFGRWLGTRYLDQPNIVWVEAGDANPAEWGAAEEVDAVAEGILDVDSVHLHTAHCARYTSGVDCCPKNWLDINTTYADCQQTARQLLTDYQRSSNLPFVYIEGRYEDERDWSAVCMRSQAYWSLLLGAQGHFFGSYKLWDFPSDGSWVATMNAVGSRSMELFHKLLRSRHYDRLVPDTNHVVMISGYGSVDGTDYAAFGRPGPHAGVRRGGSGLVVRPGRRDERGDRTFPDDRGSHLHSALLGRLGAGRGRRVFQPRRAGHRRDPGAHAARELRRNPQAPHASVAEVSRRSST